VHRTHDTNRDSSHADTSVAKTTKVHRTGHSQYLGRSEAGEAAKLGHWPSGTGAQWLGKPLSALQGPDRGSAPLPPPAGRGLCPQGSLPLIACTAGMRFLLIIHICMTVLLIALHSQQDCF